MDVDALIIRVFFDDAIDLHVVLTAYFTCNRHQISLPPTGMIVEFTTCCCCCCSSCSKRLGELSFCRLVVVCRTRSIVIYILFIEYVPDKKALWASCSQDGTTFSSHRVGTVWGQQHRFSGFLELSEFYAAGMSYLPYRNTDDVCTDTDDVPISIERAQYTSLPATGAMHVLSTHYSRLHLYWSGAIRHRMEHFSVITV